MTPTIRISVALLGTVALAGCGSSSSKSGTASSNTPKPAGPADERAITGLDTLPGGRLRARLVLRFEGGGSQSVLGSQSLLEEERAVFGTLKGTTLPPFLTTVSATSPQSGSQRADVIHTGTAFYIRQGPGSAWKRVPASQLRQTRDDYATEIAALAPGRLPLLSLTPSDWAVAPKSSYAWTSRSLRLTARPRSRPPRRADRRDLAAGTGC
jgi:hypothetical protein